MTLTTLKIQETKLIDPINLGDAETRFILLFTDLQMFSRKCENREVTLSLAETLKFQLIDYESTLSIVYQPQAVFRVRGVTRCSSSLSGHGQPVVSALFSPDARHLASGSGDKTVRFWDLTTETPQNVCTGHRDYVLALAWSPDGKMCASGDKSGQVIIWDPVSGSGYT